MQDNHVFLRMFGDIFFVYLPLLSLLIIPLYALSLLGDGSYVPRPMLPCISCAIIPMPSLVMEKSDHETCCTCISVGSCVNASPTRQVDPQGQHVRGRSQGHEMKERTNNRQPYLRAHVGLNSVRDA